jgi:hypothetical protein
VTLRNSRGPSWPARAKRAAYLTLTILIFGCAAKSEAPTPAPPEPAPAKTTEPEVDLIEVYETLDRAEAALTGDHLSSPEDGSAFALFTEALKLDPDNEEAARGFERIVERYVELALRALEREQYATARSMLARARLIDASHPSIEPTAEQIRLLSTARRTKLDLGGDLQDDSVRQQLAQFAVSPKGFDCRFVIWATSDAEGRRIYRALRDGETTTRLRAQILIRAPVSVERQCFPS